MTRESRCPATYPHHPHVWLRGGERSISDAPHCPGIPVPLSPFTRRALAGTLPAKVVR